MRFNVSKVLLAILLAGIVTVVSGLFVFIYILSGALFTKQQCELVERNFDKLKVGMTREEVLPLIGGERGTIVTFRPGNFPGEQKGESLREQKNPWQVMALCTNPEKDHEWYFIAFDTKTNRVVKILSGWPEDYGFD